MENRTDTSSFLEEINTILQKAFSEAGFSPSTLPVFARSKEPQFADYQCNSSFSVAKESGTTPLQVAEHVAKKLQGHEHFKEVHAVAPGFINAFLSDDFLVRHVQTLSDIHTFETFKTKNPQNIILDYGGPNVAKPLHVGHLRPAIIGESLKRIGRFLGHDITGDIHLGDWGLQMGMVIKEIQREQPNLPYFDENFTGEYPTESPVSVDDLERLYPQASQRAKDDEQVMHEARVATVQLQNGRKGYRALWKHFLTISIADLKENYAALGVTFDLWLGESDAHTTAIELILKLTELHIAHESEGALIVDVTHPDDKKELPPLILRTSDGSVLYGTTDLATVKDRVDTYHPDRIIYVTDKRQALHFKLVIRAVKILEETHIIDTAPHITHIGFGTMNGTDNKPFKTRAGGTLKLRDLLTLLTDNARKRIEEIHSDTEFSESEKEAIAYAVGNATLKFADLSNDYANDYVFDIERFSSFEGYTGPYLLYGAVRAKAILHKAEEAGLKDFVLQAPSNESERKLLLELLEFHNQVLLSWEHNKPSILADYTYNVATAFSTFYHDSHVMNETDIGVQSSRLALTQAVKNTIVTSLDMLGITVPERM